MRCKHPNQIAVQYVQCAIVLLLPLQTYRYADRRSIMLQSMLIASACLEDTNTAVC